jgi:hypothetical protein
MPTLSDFTDFVKSTAPAWASNENAFVNELQQNSYPLRRFLKGRDASDMFQNGERIKDGIILDEAGSFEFVGPETDSRWKNAQLLTTWAAPWRFAQAHMAWTAQEIELNEGASAETWKRVKRIKQTGLANDVVNGMNACIFRKPNAARMETFTSVDALESGDAESFLPYSIPALVSEQTNTLPNSQTTGAPGGAFSTVQTISPTTKTLWRNVQKTYGSITANAAGNLTSAFDDIIQDLEFQLPGTMNEYYESPSMFRQVIYTTKTGIVTWKNLQRAENDVTVSPSSQDPAWMRPTYAGIPLERAPQLETETLYGTSGAGVIETNTTNNNTGSRYYWINHNFLKMAFHSKYYFKTLDAFQPENNRMKYIMPIHIWFNMYCTSRRHQGVVFPSTDL